MISTKTVNTIGMVSIAIMLVMLSLLWFRIVSESYTIPFAIIAGVLFILRFVLRIVTMRRSSRHDKQDPFP